MRCEAFYGNINYLTLIGMLGMYINQLINQSLNWTITQSIFIYLYSTIQAEGTTQIASQNKNRNDQKCIKNPKRTLIIFPVFKNKKIFFPIAIKKDEGLRTLIRVQGA